MQKLFQLLGLKKKEQPKPQPSKNVTVISCSLGDSDNSVTVERRRSA